VSPTKVVKKLSALPQIFMIWFIDFMNKVLPY
jgi:hypothetical protein